MAPVVVPTFANSFHATPPRLGLQSLDAKMTAGIRDSNALIKLMRARASVHRQAAHDLVAALPTEADSYPGPGDDGGSLGRALDALRQETEAQAQAHRSVANEVDRSIVEPFEEWSQRHEDRVKDGRKQIFDYVSRWESAASQLAKAKDGYDSKCALADEADTESRLTDPNGPAPAPRPSPRIDTSSLPVTTPAKSPKALMSAVSEADEERELPDPPKSETADGMAVIDIEETTTPKTGVAGLARSVSGRFNKSSIADRLRALTSPETTSSPTLPSVSKDEKGKAKETEAPKMLEIGGITNGTREWSRFFEQAKTDLPKRSFKVPLVGVYHDVHTGAELVAYFQEHLVDLQGSYEQTFEFCRQLSEDLNILRLLGELGNKFYDSEDAMYVFNQDAFNLHRLHEPPPAADAKPHSPFTRLPTPLSPNLRAKDAGGKVNGTAPASQGLRRSGTIGAYLTTALNTAATNVSSLSAVANERLSETRQQRLYRDVETAERAYRDAVERAERARLTMDQAIAVHLPFMQRCEGDRLRHAGRAMIGFTAACAPLVRRFQQASETAATVVGAAQPERDLASLIEVYRTGNYRPQPHVFQSHEGAQDALFGIDLRRWEETKDLRPAQAGAIMPPVVTLLLDHLVKAYGRVESDHERRMSWIYEVPLPAQHRLRDRLNDSLAVNPPTSALDKADAPILASVLKLWLLELTPPIVPYQVYDEDLRPLYASSAGEEDSAEERTTALIGMLVKLPRLHFVVLDALVQHLIELVKTTQAEEADEIYRSKLALSLGRCIARPKIDTALSLDDKAPARFFGELLLKRDAVLPAALEQRTKRESKRFERPVRKRTAPVDMRLSRSQLGSEGAVDVEEAKTLLEGQLQHQHSPARSPPLAKSPPPTQQQQRLSTTKDAPLPRAPSPSPGLTAPGSESDSRSVTPDFVDAPSVLPPALPVQPPATGHIADTLATLEHGRRPSSDEVDPPFVPPSEERDPPFVPPSEERDPPFVPPVSAPAGQSLEVERDPPFVPPVSVPLRQSLSGERDAPFTPPTDDSTPQQSSGSTTLQRDGSSGLHRGPRIARGPRPPSVAGASGVQRVAGEYKKRESTGSASSRVAEAAAKFGGAVPSPRSPQ